MYSLLHETHRCDVNQDHRSTTVIDKATQSAIDMESNSRQIAIELHFGAECKRPTEYMFLYRKESRDERPEMDERTCTDDGSHQGPRKLRLSTERPCTIFQSDQEAFT